MIQAYGVRAADNYYPFIQESFEIRGSVLAKTSLS
jgi:hypothetical protein